MAIKFQLTRLEKTIAGTNLAYLLVFLFLVLRAGSTEFLIYAAVVLGAMIAILSQQARIKFSPAILWALSLWGLLHLAGGTIQVNDNVLYNLQLIPVILRYDQLIHAYGFYVATVVCDHVLALYRPRGQQRTLELSVLIVLMGLGAGGVNEIVEFSLTLLLPKTNVGGYENTMWDMVFNLLGAILAVIYLNTRQRRVERKV